MATPGGDPAETWPLWEVFVRASRGLSHVHVGSLHAPDADLAVRNARDLYTRRGEGVSIWVVPSDAVTTSDPGSKGAYFESPAGKNYRHASYYTASEGGAAPVTAPDTPATTDATDDDPHGDVSVDLVDLDLELQGFSERAATADVAEYALRLGDDALILAQQLSRWIAHAPELEEDIALGNIALDLLGHARSLLRFAGSSDGRSEDDLAYFRDEPEFRSLWLFEQDGGDFAHTIARQLIAATYLYELYADLAASTDPALSAIAAKAVTEVEYHRDHAVQWTLRLAGGTDLSRERMIAGLADMWPYVDELFHDDPLIDRLPGVAVRPSSLRARFDAVIDAVLAEEGLDLPRGPIASGGGRQGKHFPTLGYILAEMQVLARQHPGGALVIAVSDATRAREIAANVRDPEVPVLTIDDLGVLRDVEVGAGTVVVTITPTYSGCPAVDTMRDDLVLALTAAGFADVRVRTVLSPAWTTDWLTEAGRRKLVEYGIAPPTGRAPAGPIRLQLGVACPRCGSLHTREISRFGSTACKALYECRACLEPFDHFKVH